MFFFLKHGAYGWYDQSNLLSTVKGRCYGNRLNDVLNVMTTSLPSILPLVAFPKALFSALYSSSCTPHLSVLLSLLFSSTTTFTQMILSSSSLSTHSTSTQAFLTFKTLFNTSLPGWLLILLLTPPRLNSCSSDSKTNLPKYTTLHSTLPTLLETLASSLTNILLSLTKLLLSPKLVTITFVNFAVYGHTLIRQLPVPLLPLSFTPNLITVILSTINYTQVSTNPSPAYPELSCSYCHESSQVMSYHSYNPTLSSLAQDHWTHRIQAPLTYLQSSHNYPTSIPS